VSLYWCKDREKDKNGDEIVIRINEKQRNMIFMILMMIPMIMN